MFKTLIIISMHTNDIVRNRIEKYTNQIIVLMTNSDKIKI